MVQKMKKSEGFSLSEMLISMVVVGIIMAATIGLLFVFSEHALQSDEIAAARQNADMVCSIMEKPLLHAGLGMPIASSDFSAAFSGCEASAWRSPVTLPNSGRELRFLYGIPAGQANSLEIEVESGDSFTAVFSADPESRDFTADLDSVASTSNLKRWVLLPMYGFPLSVSSVQDKHSLMLTAPRSGTVSFFDELHLLRLMWLKVKNNDLYVYEGVKTNPTEGDFTKRVEGIVGTFFEWDRSEGVLTAWILARGTNRHDRPVTTAKRTPEWVEGSVDIPDFDNNKYFRLVAIRNSWRVRN
jgi:prepilin-type N-terminal cleavage/methylation domain-containing protein